MATQGQRPKWRDAVKTALNERDGAERYRPRERELRRATAGPDQLRPPDQPRPLEFDARGFPIPQSIPSFTRRVARLLREEQAK
jgi:hypothetical protein